MVYMTDTTYNLFIFLFHQSCSISNKERYIDRSLPVYPYRPRRQVFQTVFTSKKDNVTMWSEFWRKSNINFSRWSRLSFPLFRSPRVRVRKFIYLLLTSRRENEYGEFDLNLVYRCGSMFPFTSGIDSYTHL